MRDLLTPAQIRDPFLAYYGDWLDHDGLGIPAHLMGRVVLVAGLRAGSPQIVHLTPGYAAWPGARGWTWRGADADDKVMAYRVRRCEPLPFDADTLHALDWVRGGMGVNGRNPLLIGLDGAEA